MINPYEQRYPGSGNIPQANPSEGGRGGIGSDSLGTQFRDWTVAKILAQIQTHGSNNSYAFRQMYILANGAVSAVPGGITGTAATTGMPAYEVNGLTTVNSGTVVELWPQYGLRPGWGFVSPGFATTCTTAVIAVTCAGSSLSVTYGLIRVVDQTCP